MKNQIVASIAALPFALGAVFAGAGVANASDDDFYGEFQLNGGILIPFNPADTTDVSLSESGINLDFDPEPITPIGIVNNTGIFTGFDTAQIQDIISFSPNLQVENPFIDFGTTDSIAPGITTSSNDSITDGENVFILEAADYQLTQSGANIAIDVSLFGDFVIDGETYEGAGNLTFQYNNITVAEAEEILSNGGSLDDMAFSGALFSAEDIVGGVSPESPLPVPEPTVLFGLGVVAAGLVTSRRKKNS